MGNKLQDLQNLCNGKPPCYINLTNTFLLNNLSKANFRFLYNSTLGSLETHNAPIVSLYELKKLAKTKNAIFEIVPGETC